MQTSVELQRRVVEALRSSSALSALRERIYDGPPPDPQPPYLVVGIETVLDWGWKGGGGEDHRFQVSVWDGTPGMARIKTMLGEVEKAVLAMPRNRGGVRLVTLRRTRAQVRRRPKQWTEGLVEFRALAVMED